MWALSSQVVNLLLSSFFHDRPVNMHHASRAPSMLRPTFHSEPSRVAMPLLRLELILLSSSISRPLRMASLTRHHGAPCPTPDMAPSLMLQFAVWVCRAWQMHTVEHQTTYSAKRANRRSFAFDGTDNACSYFIQTQVRL
jgi:hypothetical protein